MFWILRHPRFLSQLSRVHGGGEGRLLAWGLTMANRMCPHRGPLLCCNLLELIGLGVFLVVVTVVFFLFLLPFLLEGLRWADVETASHLHRAWPAGWAEDTPSCLLGEGRKSAVRSYHFSTLGGFFFFLCLSFILEENVSLISNRAQKLGRGKKKESSQHSKLAGNSCLHLFSYFIRDAKPSNWWASCPRPGQRMVGED